MCLKIKKIKDNFDNFSLKIAHNLNYLNIYFLGIQFIFLKIVELFHS